MASRRQPRTQQPDPHQVHHIADPAPLGLFGAWALFGGTSLYLAGSGLFWRRAGGTWKTWRMLGAAVLLALVPVGAALASLGALALVVVIVTAVIAVETARNAEARREVRATLHG